MKNKLLMILLCGVMVLGFATGCGNKATNNNDNQKSEYENKEQQTGIAITETISSFENGYAVVKGTDGTSYVIDENGNSTYKLDSDKTKVVNGYIISSTGMGNYVMDGKGKTIFEKEDNKEYVSISKSGNLVVRTREQSLSGTNYKYSILDKNGKIIYADDSVSEYKYIAGDVYLYGSILVNAKTGKTYTFSDDVEVKGGLTNGYLYFMGVSNKNYIISEDLEKVYNLSTDFWSDFNILGIINEKYIYGKNTNSGNDTYAIYDMTGKIVKDLTEGGIQSIFEFDNVFYVKSNTGYIYTLDSEFNYIKDPVKDTSVLIPTTKGILAFKDSKVYLLNKNLDFKDELSYISNFLARDMDNEIMKLHLNSGYTYYLRDKFIYGKNGVIYNLDTKELLQIYK